MDALCIVSAAAADCGYTAEAAALGTLCEDLLTYEPLWGIIKNERGPKGRTRLMHAARHGELERFQWLLARGANPHFIDNNGFSALHHAAFYGHTEIVRILIRLGVDVNGYTMEPRDRALNFAAKHRYKEVVELLCAAGAKGNEFTSGIFDAIDEQYAFWMNRTNPSAENAEAADQLSADIVEILYKAGDRLGANETTAAFIKVVARGQLKTLKTLIACRYNPMMYYYVLQHEPFLHLAIHHHRIEVLRELCRIGMWINGVDGQGRSPLDMTQLWKRYIGPGISHETEAKLDAMHDILVEHGAKYMAYRSLKLY
jgi:hypothetical protein